MIKKVVVSFGLASQISESGLGCRGLFDSYQGRGSTQRAHAFREAQIHENSGLLLKKPVALNAGNAGLPAIQRGHST